jgi:hypothetical protein
MTVAVQVHEHGELLVEAEHGLEVAELDFLRVLRDRDGKSFFTEHRRGRGWCVGFAQYSGAVGMPVGERRRSCRRSQISKIRCRSGDI